ncbi:WAS/WASL-interacting protein family member 2-like [Herpailurus yagouaroundi]|uniref:WAS/WASL-interacting protein family member 2-like n=1 Tax=Herpailurus yagouaroundi TaxID=1608482 RepID=UPI001AD6FA63|nr:WAS/WASL-interacting protein family member 2-like [Puma yagouaroundi]
MKNSSSQPATLCSLARASQPSESPRRASSQGEFSPLLPSPPPPPPGRDPARGEAPPSAAPAPGSAGRPPLRALGHTPARPAAPLPRSSRSGGGALVLRTGPPCPRLGPLRSPPFPSISPHSHFPAFPLVTRAIRPVLAGICARSGCRLTSVQMCAASPELDCPAASRSLPKGHCSVPRPDVSA